MTPCRLPRFKRSSAIAPLHLTERDRQIIRLIHRHRFLRSSQILTLVGGSGQQILRRLWLLYHHGYLERPRMQLEYFTQGGGRHIVYGLGNKSRTLLKPKGEADFHELRWVEKNGSVGRVFLEHALFVSDMMVAIEVACRESGE